MNHIFISYSRKDTEYVNSVADLLRKSGLSVWQDISGKGSGIPFSTKWFSAIEEALHTSAGAAVFASEYWQKSVPCQKEYGIINDLCIPCFKAEPVNGTFLPAEQCAAAIKEWAETEVYADRNNELRTWLLSSLSTYKNTHRLNTGIPVCKTKAEAQEFTSRLDDTEKVIQDLGFRERQPDLYREMTKFISHARRVTLWNRIRKPLALCLAGLLVLGIGLSVVIYNRQREDTDKHLLALQNLDTIHDVLSYDPLGALQMMAEDENEYGEYITLLFENYAEALDTNFPCGFYRASSAGAQKIASMALQHESEYTITLSETNGTVLVEKPAPEGIPAESVSLRLEGKPQCYAVNDGYLAVAAYSNVYVYDLENGRDCVALTGSFGSISDLFFDEEGRIEAVTDFGDVYVWDNPIKEIKEIRPHTTDTGALPSSLEVSSDAQGTVYVKDTDHDCIVYMNRTIREPLDQVMLSGDGMIDVKGVSGTAYQIHAGKVLNHYSSNLKVQKKNYDDLAQEIRNFLVYDLKIYAE